MTDLRSRDDLTGSVRARRGAHRPAPHRVLGLLPVLLVLGAVGVLAFGVSLFLGLGDRSTVTSAAATTTSAPTTPGTDAAGAATAADESASADTATSEPVDGASSASAEGPTPAPTSASSTSAPSASPTTSSATSSAAVDTDTPVVVLNATRTTGLAASTARTLEREGWTVASTGNERGGAVAATVVRYPDADLEATALAVAEALGGNVEVELDEDAEEGSVTVVAGPDQAD